MKTPPPENWEPNWQQLARRARAAAAPPVDVAAAVRAALAAAPARDRTVAGEFAALFGRPSALGLCGAAAAACALLAWWLGQGAWEEVGPWAHWLLAAATVAGGAA